MTRMRVLILDNYDSFTYNLYDYIAALGANVDVVRNDEIDLDSVDGYSHIVLSPGPGLPNSAGRQPQLIERYAGKLPILGVCLGMQALGQYFGAQLYNLEGVRHGRDMNCNIISDSVLLSTVKTPFKVGLYHSWALKNLPDSLRLTALSDENVVMAFECVDQKIFGVQFHPESVMTPDGKQIIQSFLNFN